MCLGVWSLPVLEGSIHIAVVCMHRRHDSWLFVPNDSSELCWRHDMWLYPWLWLKHVLSNHHLFCSSGCGALDKFLPCKASGASSCLNGISVFLSIGHTHLPRSVDCVPRQLGFVFLKPCIIVLAALVTISQQPTSGTLSQWNHLGVQKSPFRFWSFCLKTGIGQLVALWWAHMG